MKNTDSERPYMEYTIEKTDFRQNSDEIRELMWTTFLEYEAPLFGKKGTEEVRTTIFSDSLMQQQTFYCYRDEGRLIGILATRSEGSHISFLFVRKGHQRSGIGQALVNRALEDCGRNLMTVNAATPAKGFYEKLGFVRLKEEQDVGGIRFIPMALKVQSDIITDE